MKENQSIDINEIKEMFNFLEITNGMKLTLERKDEKHFGNIIMEYSAPEISLRIIKDRDFYTVEISNNLDFNNWYDLSFINALMYDPEKINEEDGLNNFERLIKFKSFLNNDFSKIKDLFSNNNYDRTKVNLDNSLKKKFNSRFPS